MTLAGSGVPLRRGWWGELSPEHHLPKHLVPWLHHSAVVHPGVREGELAAGHPTSCRALQRGLQGWPRLWLLFAGRSFSSSWLASFWANSSGTGQREG